MSVCVCVGGGCLGVGVSMCPSVYVGVCACMGGGVCMCQSVWSVCVCVWVCMCVWVCVCVGVCVCGGRPPLQPSDVRDPINSATKAEDSCSNRELIKENNMLINQSAFQVT